MESWTEGKKEGVRVESWKEGKEWDRVGSWKEQKEGEGRVGLEGSRGKNRGKKRGRQSGELWSHGKKGRWGGGRGGV